MAKQVTMWKDNNGGVHDSVEACNIADARIKEEDSLEGIVGEMHFYNMTQTDLVKELIDHRDELLNAFCGTDPGLFKDHGDTLIYKGETRELAGLSDLIDTLIKEESYVITKTLTGHLWVRPLFRKEEA